MYSKILVPVDGSETSARGLAEAIRLARAGGGRIRLVHVVDTMSIAMSPGGAYTLTQETLDLLKQSGQEVLAKARAAVEAAGVAVETALHDSLVSRVCDVVVDEAKSWGAELIVLGTHGRRGVRRALMGSDAEQIVRQTPVPVLLVRSADDQPAG